MSLQGNIEEVGLGAIIQTLSLNQYRGTLRIETEEGGSQFFFISEGEIILVRQVKRDPVRLGDLLLRAGRISNDQLDVALAEQKKNRGTDKETRLGQTLVNLGMIEQDEIEGAVRSKFEDEFLDLFLLDKGRFEFIFGLTPEALFGPEEKLERVSLDSAGLMMEAMRRLDEWQEIFASLGSLDTIYRNRVGTLGPAIEDYEFAGVHLPASARKTLYDMLDGEHSLRNVISEALREQIATRLETFIFLHRLKENELVKPLDFKTLLAEAKLALSTGDVPGTAKYIRAILGGKDSINIALIKRYLEFLKKHKRPRLAFDEARRFAAQLLAVNDIKQAITLYETAIAIENNVEVLDRLFYALLRDNRRDRAVQIGLRVRGFLGSDAELSVAVRVCKNLKELDPKNPEILELSALILKRQERHEEAIAEFEQAMIGCDPDHVRRKHIIDAILELDPSRSELRDEQASLELQHAELMLRREARRRWLFVLVALVGVILAWRVYAEFQARALLNLIETRAEKQDKTLDDIRELGEDLKTVVSFGFTTVRDRAQELIERNDETWALVSQLSMVRGDSRVKKELDAEEERKAKQERERLQTTLSEGLKEFEALEAKGAFKAASEKALELAEAVGELFPEDTAVLRVFASLVTDPPGCAVLVGNDLVGETPCHVRVPVGGETKLSLRLAGFLSLQKVAPGSGYSEHSFTLVPGPTWHVDVGEVPLPAVVGEETVLLAVPGGTLRAIDPGTGASRYTVNLLKNAEGELVGLVAAGGYAVATYGGSVVGVDILSGAEKWRRRLSPQKCLAPTFVTVGGRPRVLVPAGEALHLLDAETGDSLQEPTLTLPTAITHPVAVGGLGRNVKAFVSLKGSVLAIDLTNDNGADKAGVIWTVEGVNATAPMFYSGSAEAVLVPARGEFRSLGEGQGDALGVLEPGLGKILGTSLIGERLTALSPNGFLTTLSVYNGNTLWSGKRVLKAVSAGPLGIGKDLVLADDKGMLFRFTSSGRRLKTAPITLGEPLTAPLVGYDQQVIAVIGQVVYFVDVSVKK